MVRIMEERNWSTGKIGEMRFQEEGDTAEVTIEKSKLSPDAVWRALLYFSADHGAYMNVAEIDRLIALLSEAKKEILKLSGQADIVFCEGCGKTSDVDPSVKYHDDCQRTLCTLCRQKYDYYA